MVSSRGIINFVFNKLTLLLICTANSLADNMISMYMLEKNKLKNEGI